MFTLTLLYLKYFVVFGNVGFTLKRSAKEKKIPTR